MTEKKNYKKLILISEIGYNHNGDISIAKKMRLKTIGFLGYNGGKAKKFCDTSLIIPSNNTARIQEEHKFMVHLILEQVETMILKISDFKRLIYYKIL